MANAKFEVPLPPNDPIGEYLPGSPERESLKKRLVELRTNPIEIPIIIDGQEVRTGDTGDCVLPHDHQTKIATYHKVGEKEVNDAIESALEARKQWAETPWENRVAVFLKAADLLTTPFWRDTINAATMLNQSKTVFQAEIDSACEIVDFWRFNCYYAQQIFEEQPLHSPNGMWNRLEYRPLEGFVFAVAPFNFTSIGANLCTAPALMGNVALLKPASSAVYAQYWLMKLYEEAGLPKGVINFVPGSGSKVGNPVINSPYLAGIHFTGSTPTFQRMWKDIGNNIANYKSYPRIVGETGGKDFLMVHNSSNVDEVVAATIRGAYEYQGQKCSALSRQYIPQSMWDEFKTELLKEMETIKVGDPEDFSNFFNAVIDKAAYDSIVEYIEYAKNSSDAEIIAGGTYDDSKGYFINPTVVVTTDPHFKTMEEEIFGPVLTIYVYEDDKYEETLDILDKTSEYALTGGVFAKDRYAVEVANKKLVNAAGNFYINDKPTGAVVGQQPFGGARASGTNDKAGSYLNLIRWASPRTIKENFIPPKDYRYPFLDEE